MVLQHSIRTREGPCQGAIWLLGPLDSPARFCIPTHVDAFTSFLAMLLAPCSLSPTPLPRPPPLFLPNSLTRLSPSCAGKLEIPQEALYKKNVLITRGRFRPFTLLHNDMLMGAASQFFCLDPNGATVSQDGDAYNECVYRDDTLVLLELTTRDMMEVLIPACLPSLAQL